jgi:hypothetical protein
MIGMDRFDRIKIVPSSCLQQRTKAFIMIPTNDSDNIVPRIIVVLVTLVIAGFFIPQETLSKNALLLLWIVMAFAVWLWIRSGLESTGEN